MAAVPYIWWRGFKMTPDFRDAIQAAEQRAGFTFRMTQGGFNAGGVSASAGTHNGDAGDWSIRGMSLLEVTAMIEALRWAGIAASLRTTRVGKWGVRPQGFGSYHVHGVPNGWGRPSAGARSQADAYRRGRDGLASNGTDVGPGHVGNFRQRKAPMKPTTPDLPDTGDAPTKPAGGLTVSDVNDIMKALTAITARLEYLEAQNKSIGDLIVATPVKVWQVPVIRTIDGNRVGVSIIQEIADIKSSLSSVSSKIGGTK